MSPAARTLIAIYVISCGLSLAFRCSADVTTAADSATPPQAAASVIAATPVAPAALAELDAPVATATLAAPHPVAKIRAAFTPANQRYAHVRQALALIDPCWDIAAALLLLFSGLSARIRDLATRRFRSRYMRVLVFIAVAGLIAGAVRLPVELFRGYWWEHRYGLSNQSLLDWSVEQLKVYALNIAFIGGTGLLALALLGIERAGRRAWVWLALGMLPVAVAGVLLSPLVFEPAFNRFEPLGNAQLDHRILALAARAGIPARHVFQVDRSRQTNTINAYVSGFGPSQRIVLWDTTLKRLSEDEILAVMGHEMGHYVLHHLWRGIALMWLLSFALFFAAARMVDASIARWGMRWAVRDRADVAALPLYALVLTLLLALAQPVIYAESREVEHEADVFGLEATHLNAAAASAFVKLGAENRSDPDPPALIRLLLYTHPPLLDRVRFAQRYHPWTSGQANQYFHGPAPN